MNKLIECNARFLDSHLFIQVSLMIQSHQQCQQMSQPNYLQNLIFQMTIAIFLVSLFRTSQTLSVMNLFCSMILYRCFTELTLQVQFSVSWAQAQALEDEYLRRYLISFYLRMMIAMLIALQFAFIASSILSLS